MTQLQSARKGIITPEMIRVAERENVTPEFIREEIARGRLIIPANVRHLVGSAGASPSRSRVRPAEQPTPPTSPLQPGATFWVNRTVAQRLAEIDDPNHMKGEAAPKRLDSIGIGRMITTKINANIGASPVSSTTAEEVEKLKWAQKYGADTLMDLSTGGDLDECRQAIIDHSTIPIGTVPIYSMILGRTIEELTHDHILKTVEQQAQQGVDFFTIHAGILRENLHLINRRVCGLVSRGGSLLAKWMIHHSEQNPFYTLFDEISAIMREYDIAYSLGDGVRPGCLHDAGDAAQIAELEVLGELTHRAREAGVQVMVEGPGHVPLHEVAWNMQIQQRICDDAPFYVLGPIVTDVFPGYDHITSCIGATEAARAGAAMLCYVTPREHVGLPRAEDVKLGCIAYKIAAHAGDIARGIQGAIAWDDDMSRARAALNWPKQFELAFDGETARDLHEEDLEGDTDYCSMCGHDWCSMRISKEIAQFASGKDAAFQPVPAGKGIAPVKRACHSDNVADAKKAKRLQKEAVGPKVGKR
ncbi:MAG TPA: phosphomethylpyrimidine synthase ThiC [Phycisphaerae bacterium]|nr:phosphomethylpyrimidine synthase ThiC [Phycisphaerae bacterium]